MTVTAPPGGPPAGAFPADPVAAATALAPLIEAERADMEAHRRIPPAVAAAMADVGVLRAAVPADLDGPAYDPLVQVRLVEELSRLDGSVGWCAMIGAAASYVAAFLPPESARRWFGPPDACLGGQLAPTGRARRVPGGFEVSGRFRFASGSTHCTAIIAGCLEVEGDTVVRTAKGRPALRTALIEPGQAQWLDTWHTTGLRGTASNDYVLDGVFVPEHDTYDPAGRMQRPEPLYRYPPLFLVPHAGVPLGIARAAVDAFVDLAAGKELSSGHAHGSGSGGERTLRTDEVAQQTVAVAEAKVRAARAFTYEVVAELWDVLQAGGRVPDPLRATYRIMMTYTHQQAKEVVSAIYDTAAGSSIFTSCPLDRHLRDIAAACQHRMVHPKIYRPAGRLLLGIDSGDPMV